MPSKFVISLAAIALGAIGCSQSSDNPLVLASIENMADPASDTQFVLHTVEQRTEACMAAAGFPEWRATTRETVIDSLSFLVLPQIEFVDGVPAGYESDFFERSAAEPVREPGVAVVGAEDGVGPIDEAANKQAANEAIALIGEGLIDGPDEVSFSVPGEGERGRLMGGCQGEAYRSVFTEEELPTFLVGEILMLDSTTSLSRRDSIAASEALDDWSNCMFSQGFEVDEPRFISRIADVDPVAISSQDFDCRVETELEEAIAEALDSVADELPRNAESALLSFEAVSETARLRIEDEN